LSIGILPSQSTYKIRANFATMKKPKKTLHGRLIVKDYKAFVRIGKKKK
jgi:hypothetical protein